MSMRTVIDKWVEKEKDNLLEYIAYKMQWWMTKQEIVLKLYFFESGNDLNNWMADIRTKQSADDFSDQMRLSDIEATVLLAVVREIWG